MGSLTNWSQESRQLRSDLAFLVDDQVWMVDVFRRRPQPGVAGLTAQTADPVFLRTTRARIDPNVSGELIGLTMDSDVRLNDLWRLTEVDGSNRWYRVSQAGQVGTSVRTVLEETKR